MLTNCEFVRIMNIRRDFVPVQYPWNKKFYMIPNIPGVIVAKDGSIMRRNYKLTNTDVPVFEPSEWRIANNRFSYITIEMRDEKYSEGKRCITIRKATLLAVMFLEKPQYFPECRIKFKDGNRRNETLDNLEFSPRYSSDEKISKLKSNLLKHLYTGKLVQHEELPGFYYIPGFKKRYIINPNSSIMYFKRGHNNWIRKKWYISHEGYASTELAFNNLVRLSITRHQLLARMFLRDQITEDIDMDRAQIDHKNEIPGDDRLSNLQIVMPVDNVSNYFSKKNRKPTPKPVQVKNIDTGVVTKYDSAISCGRQFDLSRDQVLYRLDHPEKLFPERNLYRVWSKDSENDPWPEIDNIDKQLATFGVSEPILVMDCETKEVFEYESQESFISDFNKRGLYVPIVSEVCGWFKRKDFVYRIAPNKYIRVKKKFDGVEFSDMIHYRDAYIKSRPDINPVVLTDVKTGKKIMFRTHKECAEFIGLEKYYITNRLARNDPERVYPDGFKYRYYDSQLDLDMKFSDE